MSEVALDASIKRLSETGWRAVAIDDFARVRAGVGFPPRLQGRPSGAYPFFKVSDMNLPANGTFMFRAANYVDAEDLRELRCEPMPRGTVIFPKVGAAVATNKKRILAQSSLVDNNVMGIAITDTEICDSEFLLRWLQAFDLREWSNPGPLPSVTARTVKSAVIHLPPLFEQRAIVHVLGTIQRAREQTEQVLAAAQSLKSSLMRQLFTHGPESLASGDPTALKETQLGQMPDRWSVSTLGAVVSAGGGSIQTGPFGSLLHAADYVDDGVPSVMPKDMTSSGRITTSNGIARIGMETRDRLARYALESGDVLVARRGEIGRRALVTEREAGWICGTGCLRVRPGARLNPRFLAHAFEATSLRRWLEAHSVGATMANLSTTILNQMPVPLPALEEQEVIAEILDAADAKIAVELLQRDAFAALFSSLLYDLMRARLRVDHLASELGR